MRRSTLFAIASVSLFALYLYERKKEGSHNKKIPGIDLSINPNLLVDTTLGTIPMHPLKKELLRAGAKKIINSYSGE